MKIEKCEKKIKCDFYGCKEKSVHLNLHKGYQCTKSCENGIKYQKRICIKDRKCEKCTKYIEKTKKIQTKNGQDMLFITGSDETSTLEFVLFPRQFCDIMIGSIYVVDGRVERRLDKYQVIVSRIRKVENEE